MANSYLEHHLALLQHLRNILGALGEVSRERTTLVIAHRLSTVRDANTIIVLDRGRVVESGQHHSLLARDGHYARLWHQQHRPSAVDTPDGPELSPD